MAAGMGSRFGGPKQFAPVGPSNETLMDYVLFDAQRSGFERAVLVIRDELAPAMALIANRHAPGLRISVAFQSMAQHMPRGTVPAVLSAADQIEGEFAALNADDFYGAEAYRLASTFLRAPRIPDDTHGVVTFPLGATLSLHGEVTRAVCESTGDNLHRLHEVHGLVRRGDTVVAGNRHYSGRARVSMNFWAFRRGILPELAREFEHFRSGHQSRDELPLPVAIDALIAARRAHVRLLNAPGPWLGLTHATDIPAVRSALRDLTDRGEYPSPLWG